MISIFLRCVNKFGQYPQNLILNKKKRLRNFIIEWKNGSLYILIRNKSSTLGIETETKKYLFVNEKFNEIQNDNLTYKCMQKSKIESILSNIQCADHIDSSQVISLLDWCNDIMDCKPLEKVGLAKYIWSHSDICNIPMTICHYNKLLEIYLRNDYNFSPMEFLQEMTDKKIFPNVEIYENCIKYYCMQGNINYALLLVKHMKEKEFPITEIIYNSLITAYGHIDDIENVVKTLIRMEENNIKPTVETYTAISNIYAKKNNINKIKEIINLCNASNIHFSNKNILNVIYTLIRNNHMKHVVTMYRYIKDSSDCSPNEIRFLLKLININQINVVKNILLHYKHLHLDIVKLILQTTVYTNMDPEQVIDMCNFMENKKMCKDSLSWALYYSYFTDDDNLSFFLLRKYKLYHIIKSHYFWPLLMKKANKYDFKGILNILKIMINEFHVPPCIDTIAMYILPFSFGNEHSIRELLVSHNINQIVFDNAYVLYLLQTLRMKNAVKYMKTYPNYYLYTVIGHDLRYQLNKTHDIQKFVHISKNLVKDMCLNLNFKIKYHTKVPKSEFIVPMEKQLLDFMNECPSNKVCLIKIILHLVNEKVSITDKTANEMKLFLKEYLNKDVILALDTISNRMVET